MIAPPTLSVEILATRFFSTHHAAAADLLANRERPFTAPTFELVAGRARRFTSLVTQMHLEVCGALQSIEPKPAAAIFATCEGEIQTAEKLIADVRESSMVSSARFALSVHNTPSGVYSVATGSTAPTTTITGTNAIAAGWLEAVLTVAETGRAVLLSLADEPVPSELQGPTSPVGVAAGFLLGPGRGRAPRGRLAQLAFTPGCDDSLVDSRVALARAADASLRDDDVTVTLGRIRPGAMLELRWTSHEARS